MGKADFKAEYYQLILPYTGIVDELNILYSTNNYHTWEF